MSSVWPNLLLLPQTEAGVAARTISSYLESSKQPLTCTGSPVTSGSGRKTNARPARCAAAISLSAAPCSPSAPPSAANASAAVAAAAPAASPEAGSGAATPTHGVSPRLSLQTSAARRSGPPPTSALQTSHRRGCPTGPAVGSACMGTACIYSFLCCIGAFDDIVSKKIHGQPARCRRATVVAGTPSL